MRLVIKQLGQNPQVQSVGTPPQTTIGGPISGAGYKTRNTAGLEDETTSEEEMLSECGCGCPLCMSGEHHPEHDIESEPIEMVPATEKVMLVIQEKKKKKGDRCVRIARRKYHKWPSAYASGAVVKCRQGKIWKDLKETIEESIIDLLEEGKIKDKSLHDWFSHRGGGWVNCRTGGPCGRAKAGRGAKGKYPACRPTMSQCKSGAVRRKKGPKTISWKDQRKKE
jgi:hypothetical protein